MCFHCCLFDSPGSGHHPRDKRLRTAIHSSLLSMQPLEAEAVAEVALTAPRLGRAKSPAPLLSNAHWMPSRSHQPTSWHSPAGASSVPSPAAMRRWLPGSPAGARPWSLAEWNCQRVGHACSAASSMAHPPEVTPAHIKLIRLLKQPAKAI